MEPADVSVTSLSVPQPNTAVLSLPHPNAPVTTTDSSSHAAIPPAPSV